ncbi:MAG: hypothetical protein M1480_11350 [Bacteroidetes bacterium]|nr:hypothetical protein [Bacteroidota bacterium]
MIDDIQIRQATTNDIDFVIEAIIESEKSSSNTISSCNVFNIPEEKFRSALKDILQQDIENYDYFLSGFLVAELKDEYIGASGSWLESIDGTPSGLIKATVLFPYLDKTKVKEVSKNTQIIKNLTFTRKKGTLQLEHGYVREPYRRQGIFTQLVKENIKRNFDKYKFDLSQVILFKQNYKSYNANLKVGYQVVEERNVDNPEIFNFFPFNTKVLMEFNKENIMHLLKEHLTIINSYDYSLAS